MIRDQLLVNNDLSILKRKCPSCSKPANHFLQHCNLLSYTPKAISVIERAHNSTHQRRELFTRNMIRIKFNSLASRPSIQKNQRLYTEKNASKLGTPKNKSRRPGIYDMNSFLNMSNNAYKKSSSLPYEQEDQQNVSYSFDNPEDEEEEHKNEDEGEIPLETSIKHQVTFNQSNSFYSASKESPNHSPFDTHIDETANILSRIRKDPSSSQLTFSKSSSNPLHQEQLARVIINHGIPQSKQKSSLIPKPIRKLSKERSKKLLTSLTLVKKKSQQREKTLFNLPSNQSISPMKSSFMPTAQIPSVKKDSKRSSVNSSDSDEPNRTVVGFDKVRNFSIYKPQNNIETLIKQMSLERGSPIRGRKRCEVLLKFKKVVNTVRNSQKRNFQHDFSKKNQIFVKKYLQNQNAQSPEFKESVSPMMRPCLNLLDKEKKTLKLEKVPMENQLIIEKKGYSSNILDKIAEEENSYDKGSLL